MPGRRASRRRRPRRRPAGRLRAGRWWRGRAGAAGCPGRHAIRRLAPRPRPAGHLRASRWWRGRAGAAGCPGRRATPRRGPRGQPGGPPSGSVVARSRSQGRVSGSSCHPRLAPRGRPVGPAGAGRWWRGRGAGQGGRVVVPSRGQGLGSGLPDAFVPVGGGAVAQQGRVAGSSRQPAATVWIAASRTFPLPSMIPRSRRSEMELGSVLPTSSDDPNRGPPRFLVGVGGGAVVQPGEGGGVVVPAFGDRLDSSLPVGAEYCIALCDLGVFVDQPAEPVRANYPDARIRSGRRGTQRYTATVSHPAISRFADDEDGSPGPPRLVTPGQTRTPVSRKSRRTGAR